MRDTIAYPVMVYKNGARGEYRSCKDVTELVLAADDNFWPIFIGTKEATLNMTCVQRGIKASIERKEDEEAKEEKVKDALETPSLFNLEEQFTKETGKKAIHKGKEVREFIEWKSKKENNNVA